MKYLFLLISIAIPCFVNAQNVGIGTTTPLTNLHVKNGAAGVTPFPASLLAVESSVNTYINLLSPAVNETAILFGQPGSAANGVIMYNNPATPNGFQFRNNGNLTRMSLANNGNLGIGMLSANAKLSVTATGSELAGSTASTTFRTNAGSLGTTLGSEINLASIGFSSTNNSSLGIRAYRHTAGSDWTGTSLVLGYDVDNTIRAGGFLTISSNSNIGIGTPTPQAKLHVYAGDGSLALFGPSNFGGQLYIGAGPNQNLAQTAQVLSPDGSLYIDPASNRNICLGCNQPRDIYINPYGGKVGVGTPTPVYPLDVKGNLFRVGYFENTSTGQNYEGVGGKCVNSPGYGTGVAGYGGYTGVYGEAVYGGSGGSNNRYGVQGFGAYGAVDNIGVYGSALGNGTNGQSALGVYGTANGSNNNWAGWFIGSVFSTGVFVGSDRKLKNDINPLNDALSLINKLKPTVYSFNTGEYKQMNFPEGLQYGLIADEVQQVIPGIVKRAIQPAIFENNNSVDGKKLSERVEFNAVNYTGLIPILIAAVKEQQLMIEALKLKTDKSDQQQKQIDELKILVEKLLKQ